MYVACALGSDADIWSDDSDSEQLDIVGADTASDVIDSFDTL
ncbi:hypothetical protein VB773_15640 [Haloarculaceae archaeon H-GB2-1]|nr:hypothetical protein [Haloarculaceae archaeon H-GB2-1]